MASFGTFSFVIILSNELSVSLTANYVTILLKINKYLKLCSRLLCFNLLFMVTYFRIETFTGIFIAIYILYMYMYLTMVV